MARKVEEQCMFCGTSPCSCEGVAPPKAAKKAAKPRAKAKPKPAVEVVPDNPKSEVSRKDDDEMFGSIPTRKTKFRVDKKQEGADLSIRPALMALREIVTEGSQREIDKQLNPPYPQDIDRRVHQFKEARRET